MGLKDAARLSQIRLGLRWALMGSGGGSNGGAFHIGTAMRHILPMCIVVNRCAYPHIFANISVYSRIIRIIPHLPHHYAFVASAWPSLIPTQDRMVRHAFRASERVRWGSKMMQAALRDETLRDASCAAGENQPTPCLSFLQLTLGIDTKTEIDIHSKIKELAQKRRRRKVKQGSCGNHNITRYDFST